MRLATRPVLRRILFIDQAVRAGRYPNSENLAGEMEVNPRTVQRDLEFMRHNLAAPLAFCRRRNGYFYSSRDYRLPFFQLTEGELVALFLAERILHQSQGSPFEEDLQRAVFKIVHLLPEEVTLNLNALSEAFSLAPGPIARHDAEVFHTLSQAAAQGRRVDIDYWTASRDTETHRAVDPYHLTRIGSDWYAIAYCHLRRDVRTFALARILAARENGETFTRPADFDVAAHLSHCFRILGGASHHEITLRFTPKVARRVAEKTWHPTQRLDPRPDGSLLFHLYLSDLREIKSWVLSWGKECEVIHPNELQVSIKKELMDIIAKEP